MKTILLTVKWPSLKAKYGKNQKSLIGLAPGEKKNKERNFVLEYSITSTHTWPRHIIYYFLFDWKKRQVIVVLRIKLASLNFTYHFGECAKGLASSKKHIRCFFLIYHKILILIWNVTLVQLHQLLYQKGSKV